MSVQKPHTTTDVGTDQEPESELSNQPMELRHKNRLYTTSDQRQRLGVDYQYGRGVRVAVVVSNVQRDEDYTTVETAGFKTKLRYYGEIGIPQAIIDKYGWSVGDDFRVKIIRQSPPEFSISTEV